MDADERALVDRARQGDESAARDLIARLYPLVAKIVRGYRPQRTGEEDLCQMIFVKVFHNLSQYSGQAPISHWVSRIAVNTCRNQLASEKTRPELRHADLSEDQVAMLDNLASTDDAIPEKLAARDLVGKLLDSLKPVERLIVDLLYLQGKTVAEIRKITGQSASAIKVTAFRARLKLRKQVGSLL